MDPTLELETFTIFCRSGERHSSAKEVAADQLTRADDAAAAAAATGSLPFWDVAGKSRKIILFFFVPLIPFEEKMNVHCPNTRTNKSIFS